MSHYDDEVQVEALKRWWSENWKALAAGLVLGLGGIFGWRGWQEHRVGVAAEAAQVFEDLRKAAETGRADDVQALADKLMKEYSGTPYAAQAALRLAQQEVQAGRLDEAREHLAWVAQRSGDEGLRHVARLRQVRVLWQQNNDAEALTLLEKEKDTGAFAALYEELRGDIKLAQGDRGAAAEAYRKALAGGGVESNVPVDREGLQRKLDDLADVAQAS